MTDQQRTPEWFAERLGKVTASRVHDIIARTKSGYSAARDNYLSQLVVERLTGHVAESYSNSAMQWGTDQEPFARAAYELYTGSMVEEVGFIKHPIISDSGASPDGLVGADGLIEIKCPSTATMIETWLDETIPAKYITQMQWQMACTGKTWCDYVCFDPRMPEGLQLYIKTIKRDDEYVAMLEKEVSTFCGVIRSTLDQLQDKLHKRR